MFFKRSSENSFIVRSLGRVGGESFLGTSVEFPQKGAVPVPVSIPEKRFRRSGSSFGNGKQFRRFNF